MSEATDLGGGARAVSGDEDGYVVAFDSDGAYQSDWVLGGASAIVRFERVAPYSDGDVLVAARFMGTVSLGGDSVTAGELSLLLLRVSLDGTVRWHREFGPSSTSRIEAVAVTGDFAYVGGGLAGPLDLGGGPIEGGFILALDAAGDYRWHRALAGFPSASDGEAGVNSFALRMDGSLLVTGAFGGTVDFGGGGLRSFERDLDDVFVARYAADGTHLRDRAYGQENLQASTAIVVGPGGAVTIGGVIIGSADFGSGTRTTGSVIGGFLARIAD